MKHCYFLTALFTGLFLCSAAQQRCGSEELMRQQMAANPEFAKKIRETEISLAGYERKTQGKPITLTIPVIVHIVYNTAAQNISDDQVRSQIDVLNEDFTARNRDYNNYDAGYGAVKGDPEIQFCLVQIVRVATTHKSFPISDGVKFTKRGGSDAINPMNALNIWVCNLGQNLLGYAQFPGGAPETFGVVCHYQAFGKGSQYSLFADYNLGRTMTHEVGHCLGLRHIWGDANCGNDFVDDTPLHNSLNFGCPEQGHRSTCTGTPLEMWMNYMDYTDDRCMYFFTDGQVTRSNFFIETDAQISSIFASSCTQLPAITTLTSSGQQAKSNRQSAENLFTLFPNPSSGTTILKYEGKTAGNYLLRVYDLTGKILRQQSLMVTNGSSAKEIEVKGPASGMYLIRLSNATTDQTLRLMIQ